MDDDLKDERESVHKQSPLGMRPDGELNIIDPDKPLPQPKILKPDGTVLTPEEADETESE